VKKEELSRHAGDTVEDVATRKTAGERIFESARALFYQRGIRAVGVDEIVAEAGVTKPSLYRAYASKDILVAACVEQCIRETRDEIDALLESAPDEPRERLDALMRFYSNRLHGDAFRGCPLSNVAVEFPEPSNPARIVAEGGKAEMRAKLLELTQALGIAAPELLADGLMLVLEGAMTLHHLSGSAGPASALLDTARALIAAHVDGWSQS
jgi:AcrR family transcriptional regulator